VFKSKLKERFERIFGFPKTTFDTPSDQFEQEVLFISIDQVLSRISEGKETARVTGTLTVYSQHDKFPFGYMAKRIQKANFIDTQKLFFYDFEEDPAGSPARVMNLSERRLKFVFLYDSQYDPNQGQLTSVDFGGSDSE